MEVLQKIDSDRIFLGSVFFLGFIIPYVWYLGIDITAEFGVVNRLKQFFNMPVVNVLWGLMKEQIIGLFSSRKQL